jgi:CTD kinase subunit gamma CTK3
MDPFEVRIRFTGLLQHLNASLTSANKAAQYALKYRDMDEDLHSCILEQLERVSSSFTAFPHLQISTFSPFYILLDVILEVAWIVDGHD